MPATDFNRTIDGQQVSLYTLRNARGMHCAITNYGGRIISLHAPDREGNLGDVVLGHDQLECYRSEPETYFGAIVGRVANRISNSSFDLDGATHHLPPNEGIHHLHGGPDGFHARVWQAEQVADNELHLRLASPHGDQGYPGTLEVTAVYLLRDDQSLDITYTARTDRPTPVSLTNHSYFNLRGAGSERIDDHLVQIHASRYCPIATDFIPIGTTEEVASTPFDFRLPTPLRQIFEQGHPQLEAGKGVDHHFIPDGSGMRAFAKIWEPLSGRTLEVWSDAPGMQFYSGNFLDGSVIGKGGIPCGFRSAFCVETQGYPNSVNQPNFPAVILRPEETYRHRCLFSFGVSDAF